MYWLKPIVLLQFLRYVFASFMRHRGLENAKSLTFTSLFAVVPLLTITIVILSLFPSFQEFANQVEGLIFERLLPSSSSDLQSYLANFAEQAIKLTWVGAVMLMVTSYLMLVSIERSLNSIWGIGELRKGLSSFLLYWSVLSLGPLLLVIGFAVSSYITSLVFFESITQVSDAVGASNFILSVFPMILTASAFTLLYVAVPNCGVQLRHGIVGGVIVALAFTISKQIFARFIATASFEFIYGTFAAIPIFLLWIYVSWVIILLGANLVRSIPLFSGHQVSNGVHPCILLLALLHNFWEKHQAGESLKIRELINDKWPFREIQLETFLEILRKRNIIRVCDQDEYLLARDLHTLSVWEIFSWMPWPLPGTKDLTRVLPAVLEKHLPEHGALRQRFLAVEEKSKEEFTDSLDNLFRTSRV